MIDESGAPWPYDPVAPPQPKPGEPTWECPGGLCECHTGQGEVELADHTIVFHDEQARRLAGARCRVFENGKLLNLDAPFADGAGAVRFKARPDTRWLLLQWVPKELPQGEPYPFQKIYYRDLGANRAQAVERRLHNIGFSSAKSLDENIAQFQRSYLQKATGLAKDVEVELVGFNDDLLLPPLPAQVGPDDPNRKSQPDAAQQGPAARPGVQAQGVVAAVQLITIKIRVATRYLITMDMFETKGADWNVDGNPGPTFGTSKESKELQDFNRYNLRRIIRELGGTSEQAVSTGTPYRFDDRANTPIVGATVKLTISADASFGTSVEITEPTKADGVATFLNVPMRLSSAFPLGKPINAFVTVDPPAKQLSKGPAGPNLATKGVTEDFLFRPFQAVLHLQSAKTGAFTDVDTAEILTGTKPRFASVFSSLPIKGDKNGVLIELDWKPDWMRGQARGRTIKSRFTDRFSTEQRSISFEEATLVLHQTGNQNVLRGTLANFFHTAKRDISAHYVVDVDGHAVKMVDESDVSHHGNPSAWKGRNRVNEFSVGMEIVHTNVKLGGREKAAGEDDSKRLRRYPEEQLETVRRICKELIAKYAIKPSFVATHSDINVRGTTIEFRQDPSETFDWEQLEADGIGLRPVPYTGNDASLVELRNTTEAIPEAPPRDKSLVPAREATIKRLKELLWEIGYVSQAGKVAPGTPLGQTTQLLIKPSFSGIFDEGLRAALKAFQLRYFTGERRRYSHGVPHPEPSAGPFGTLDPATIRAIVDVWNDMSKRG